jgi:molybdopterin-guanine dinucleotide biosynthesis protein A
MVSAILMAGYNNKREVKKYSKIVAEHYGEKFIETGYKPLREFKTIKDGKEESKPLIQYTLETLFACDLVDEIVIVGHQMLLEQRLGNLINEFEKPCCIVNQNSKIPANVIKRFNISQRKVKQSSIAGNSIKGYAASTAFRDRKHALFVASDSPLTTREFIERFLNTVQKYQEQAAIIFPAVLIKDSKDKLGRYPVKLLNDTQYQLSNKKNSYGRQGFRLSPLVFANPHFININTANTAYSLRKCLNPRVQLKLLRIMRRLGYTNVYSKYFLRKDLSIKEVENITSEFFDGRAKLIPMTGEEATYDYDGTDLEYRMITDMLNSA